VSQRGDGGVRPLLAVEGLDAFLGESHILHGVSFQVPEGGITALLGRNGVGKTTTIRSILGLVRRRGRVVLGGEDVSRLPTHEVVDRGIGYVPEDRDVFAGLTVAENLRIAERRGSEHRYDLVYELFPRLKERARQRAGTMSGGEQQMLALGRALLNENLLLLIDEPTKGLAPAVVAEVAQALERITSLTTAVVVEQNLAVVNRIARDAVVLDQGQVVYAGRVDRLLQDESLTRDLLGVSGRGGGQG
jgi:branched-chain amino acid transport system ATP-binding protein